MVRAIQGTEHAQLGCLLCLCLLPRANKRPASEKDAYDSKLCQDMFNEVQEVLKAQKVSRDKSCALIQILLVIKMTFGSPIWLTPQSLRLNSS